METIISRAHGHVLSVRKMFDDLSLLKILTPTACRQRDTIEALFIAKILNPQARLATNRLWHTTTIKELTGVEDADADEIYEAMDWLLEREIVYGLMTDSEGRPISVHVYPGATSD